MRSAAGCRNIAGSSMTMSRRVCRRHRPPHQTPKRPRGEINAANFPRGVAGSHAGRLATISSVIPSQQHPSPYLSPRPPSPRLRRTGKGARGSRSYRQCRRKNTASHVSIFRSARFLRTTFGLRLWASRALQDSCSNWKGSLSRTAVRSSDRFNSGIRVKFAKINVLKGTFGSS